MYNNTVQKMQIIRMHGCILPCHDFKKSKGPALICRNTFIYMENYHQKKNTKFRKDYEQKKGTTKNIP